MTLSKKSKTELFSEVKKLQKKIESLQKIVKSQSPLSLQNSKWESFFKNAANTILIVDKKGRILDINRSSKKENKQNIIGKTVYNFVATDAVKKMKQAINAVFKTKKPQTYDSWRLDGKDRTHYYRSKVTAIIENKKVIAVLIDAADVTNERIAQNQLKQSEEKFKKLSDAAFEGVVIHQHGKIAEVNKALCRIFGYKENELIGQSIFKYIHPDYHPLALEKLKNNDEKEYEMVMLRAGNKPFWAELMASGLMYNNAPARVAAIRDVTAYKEYEKKIKESEERFRMLAQNAADIVFRYSVHPEYKQEYVSPSVKKITGYSPQDYYKDAHLGIKIIHPDDLYLIHQLQKQKHKREKSIEGFNKPLVLRWIKKNGGIIWTETVNKPIYDEKGKLIAVEGISRDITERKNAEEILKESEEKFRMLAENASDLIYRYRVYPETHYEYVGPSAKSLTGYSPEEFYAQPMLGFKIIHPDDIHLLGDSEKLIKERAKLSNVKGPELTLRWIKKDGSVIWTETRSKPIFDSKGRLTAIEGISRDVTKQKESEEQLKDSEERFKILSNATFEGIVFSENGKIIDANDQFVKMYGFSSSKEIIGKHIIDDFVVDQQKALARRYVRLQKSEPFEVQTIQKDGTIITVETKGQNIPYFGRNIRATVIYNITERKQYEFSLRESERTLSTLMNNLPGMAYRSDYDDRWTMRFVSKGFQELTGYNPKEIINNKKRAFADIVFPPDRNVGTEQIKKAIKTRSPFEIEYRIIHANGQVKWVWEKGEGVFSDDGQLLFLEGFITDVNDKKRYELELQQSRENYKGLVERSPDGILIHVDGKVVFANPSAEKVLEAPHPNALLGCIFLDFVLPQYHQIVTERIQKIFQGEHISFMDAKAKTLKGNIIEIETQPILITYNGKQAIQVVMHDTATQKQLIKEQLRAQMAEETNQKLQQEIAERKNAERVLQQTEKYTRLLIDSSLDMICASDKDGNITEFNSAAQQTFGYKPNEIVGKHVSILYANPEERIRITNEELYGKGVFAGEVVNLKKNGEKFVAYLSASILKNEAGEIMGAMGVSRDISELKKSEEQLRTQSAKLNSIIESSSHVIWTVDKNYCLTSFNKNFNDHMQIRYGIPAKIGLSTTSGDAVSNDEYNRYWINKYNQVLKGSAQYFETKLIDKYGNLIWREIYLNPIVDEKGNVIEVSGIGHDITEKKLADEKIRQSLQEKEVLLKEVHHRVKNNLQVISSILNLQSSYVKDASTLNILKESQNRIKSMAFIHESLYQTKDFSSINFSEYVVNLSQNLIHSYANFDHEIKLNLDIQNVFLNLDLAIPCGLIINEIVSNALKYAFIDNSEEGEIDIRMSIKDDDLILIIGDNGVGLPSIIDYRNTESLGLQLVVTLTDQLNGSIELDRKKGTVYTIIFKQNQVKNRI